MLPNLIPITFMPLLNIGNIVSLGSYLYRSHFKQYFQLALFAHLWLLVPIYGWAKFYAIAGLISRLAFNKIIGQEESLKSAVLHVNRRLWRFLLTGILVLLICLFQFLLFYLLISLVSGIIYGILAAFFGFISQPINQANPFGNILFTIIIIPTGLAVYLSPLWFYSRLFITELPLAKEDNINAVEAIKRSRKLSKDLRLRIISVIILCFLITLPIQILSWLIFSFTSGIFLQIISQFVSANWVNKNELLVSSLVLVILSLINGAILMPFWQSVKSVVYYDIVCRREGYDLKLRDRNVELKLNSNNY